jgi:DNA-binding beta-propeller fold protein YncE
MKKINHLFRKAALCCVFAISFTAYADGVFILNEGGFNTNDASLSYYNLDTQSLTRDIADGVLGVTAQDMLLVGSKLFVSVTGSSYIAVFDAETREWLESILLFDGANPREPRYLATQDGKIYVSCYDRHSSSGSVLRVDAATYLIEATAKVGEFPEGIAIWDNKLYVANSGGQSATGPDNTVSVVDLASFTEVLPRITVGINPYIMKADGAGNLFLTYQGDWFTGAPGGFQKINTADKAVTNIGSSPKQYFELLDGFVYYYDVDYTLSDIGEKRYGKYNTKTGATATLIDAGLIAETPYGVGVNPRNGDIYISDSDFFNPGTVTVFNAGGERQKQLAETGINPSKFAFYFSGGGAGTNDITVEREAVAYYSLLGVKLSREPEKGIYIILYNNGTTEKRVK